MYGSIIQHIRRSPSLRTAISVLLSVVKGIFSNTFVTDISVNGTIYWASFYESASLYVVIFSAILTFVYNRYCHAQDIDISDFGDQDYCLAYARSQLLPEQIELYKKKIRNGEMDAFKGAMDEIKKVVK